MGGGYSLSESKRMQVVQSDYFEIVGRENTKEAAVRDKFGIQSWKTWCILITCLKRRKHHCIMHCLALNRCSIHVYE